jgi:hypothetical protein
MVELEGELQDEIDLSNAPADVMWLHWDGDHGHIEFDNSQAKTPWDDRKGNDYLSELPAWAQNAVAKFHARKQVKQAEREQQEAAEAANRERAMAEARAQAEAREEEMFQRFEHRMRGQP